MIGATKKWNFLLMLIIIELQCSIRLVQSTYLFSFNPNDVSFHLYKDKNNTDLSNEIQYGNEKALRSCGYDPSKPLIILVHGALSNRNTLTDVRQVKNAYLEAGINANIVMADHGKLVSSPVPIPRVLSPISVLLFVSVPVNSVTIGRRIADFITFAMKSKVLRGPQDVHLVGFSIGAHFCGVAGRYVKQRMSKPIRRITGLDPSPQIPLPSLSLGESDAMFVDVTYTSFGYLAMLAKLGHAQFFINGGVRQPNCPSLFPFADPYCSHTTAAFYFASSVKNRNIPACKCGRSRSCQRPRRLPKCTAKTSNTNYGQFVPESTRGNFLVQLA